MPPSTGGNLAIATESLLADLEAGHVCGGNLCHLSSQTSVCQSADCGLLCEFLSELLS